MLLDIHRDEVTEDTKFHTRKIVLTLAKNNPHYEANKKFVDYLLKNIQSSKEVEKNVEPEILTYDKGKLCFNQDLSNNSVLIELGNSMSSDSDIQDCVNAIVSAVKNIQKEQLTN